MHLKDSQSNQSSKGRCKDISCVQNRDASGKLLARIERGEDVQGTWIVWRFSNTKEETSQKQPRVVSTESREPTDDSPDGHARCHPQAGADTSDYHVCRNAYNDISNKQDRHACLVLRTRQVEVFFEGIESSEGDGITVLNDELALVFSSGDHQRLAR